ncbi:MAG: putative ABC transport system permease protein [Rhodothermales bacterium]|jgi:putative ABC transport system permease protein
MDDEFEETYRSESVIGTLANTFAGLAILIACLGLFGLASFTAEQRNKEIGIRKVLGASVSSVVLLLSREFMVLVLGAFVVAAPVAHLVMSSWLDDFTFHTEIGFGTLAGAGIGSILIAWLTVSYQSFRAAAADPAVSLRAD